ncbi:MAG: hypothetical protein KC897_08315 [Candidatus Omnitrophica bacterium]|nr:hypothetical protein [Candidatus Omnitrophota bacterium]MCB9721621.1 hypothetical protein [Candidatus Omnitrophota bacterium]
MKRYSAVTILLLALSAAPTYAAGDDPAAAVFNNDRIMPQTLQLSEDRAAGRRAELSEVKFQQFEYTYRMETLARRIHAKMKSRLLAEYGYEVTDLEVNAYLQQVRKLRSKMSEADLIQVRSQIADWHFDSILFDRFGGLAVHLPNGRIKPVEAYYAYVEKLMAEKVLFFPMIEYRAALKILSVYFEREKYPAVHELEARKYFLQPSWGPFNDRYNALPMREKLRIRHEIKRLRTIKKAP